MSWRFKVFLTACAASAICSALQAGPISVQCVSYTPGTTPSGTLNTTAYKDTADAKFQDFPRNTGGGTNKFARGLSNNSFAASTILPIWQGGGATFKFQQPVSALAGAKEFAIHNGTFLSTSGGFFYGDMEAAILVSSDNSEWRTLAGTVVADPLTYTGTVYDMNAPTMSYVWGTGKTAWDYCTGSGKPQSVLDTFPLADFESPMPDDSLFNGSGTNADRAALKVSTNPADYANAFGATAGGNWFDISNSGLSQIQYLRINVAANAPAVVRLDSIFANAIAVPEPAALLLIVVGVGGLWLRRSPRRWAVALLVVMASPLAASASPYSAFDFANIDYWVGSGSKQAALVVDFRTPSGDASYTWGYKWSGTATGEDMFRAIAGTTVVRERDGGAVLGTSGGSDSRLYLRSSSFGSGLGNSVFGIGYDVDGDGGSFVSGYEGDETGHSTDSEDVYHEGWFNGYWSYWISEPTAPAWGYSGLGFSSRQLTDGSWDGWSYADFNAGDFGTEPAIPIAAQVPEPAVIVFLLTGGVVMILNRRSRVGLRFMAIMAAVVLSSQAESRAVGIAHYQLVRSFSLPAASPTSGGQVLFDSLPDGRLLLLNGAAVSVETTPQSGVFNSLGNVAGFAPAFGPSFLVVSPDGTHAAAGTNGGGSVAVFSTSNPLSVTNYNMQDSSAEWIDNRYLAVANVTMATSGVQVLDTNTSTVTQVIANIGGYSSGVSFDAAGNLYAGNGSDFGPTGSGVGWVKAFSAMAWQNALATSTPIDFEAAGTPVTDVLTAYPIGFDVSGNMFVGGGEMFSPTGDKGYAGLIDAAAIAAALASPQASPPITPASPASVLRKFASPQDTIDSFLPPSWNYNLATKELYLNYAFGDGIVSVYAAVPEPSCFVLLAMCGMLVTARFGRKS